MFTLRDIYERIESCWILPDGTIESVPSEMHEHYLPDAYATEGAAEKACVKFSCGWGISLDISEIYLPDKLTIYQAQRLVEIEETIQANINERYMKSLKDKIKWYRYRYQLPNGWDSVLEMI